MMRCCYLPFEPFEPHMVGPSEPHTSIFSLILLWGKLSLFGENSRLTSLQRVAAWHVVSYFQKNPSKKGWGSSGYYFLHLCAKCSENVKETCKLFNCWLNQYELDLESFSNIHKLFFGFYIITFWNSWCSLKLFLISTPMFKDAWRWGQENWHNETWESSAKNLLLPPLYRKRKGVW